MVSRKGTAECQVWEPWVQPPRAYMVEGESQLFKLSSDLHMCTRMPAYVYIHMHTK